MEFEYNGMSIILEPMENELYSMFIDRGWFIIYNIESNKIHHHNNFDTLNKLSKIYVNQKYFKCKYPKEIEDTVSKMSSKILKKLLV